MTGASMLSNSIVEVIVAMLGYSGPGGLETEAGENVGSGICSRIHVCVS